MTRCWKWNTWWFTALIAAAAWALPAGAQSDPRVLVEETTDQVLALLEEHGADIAGDPVAMYEVLGPVVIPYIDFDHIGSRVLGPYWRDADDATRERFIVEFRRSLLRTYGTALEDYSGFEAETLGARRRDGTVQVGMEVRRGDVSARVIYVLHETGDSWKLIDIVAEGVSLVHNYREDFRARLRERSLDEVIEAMARRNREIGFP